MKAGDRLEGRKLRKVKSIKSKVKNNAKTRRGLKTTSGGGARAVRCVGSLCKDGKEVQGGSEG